ncbi:MAG TPA: Dabb family protein [Polyangiaceae bacterium]|jgi:hypothetical protein|nr:Dabb family protein [Polyangiaceae bacterium]
MVRHVLMLQPRAGVTPQQIDSCRAALTGLVGRIPGLLDCKWGENLAPAERREQFTHGFSMDFVDLASLQAYGPHPDHKPVAALVRTVFERVVVFDWAL